MESVKFYPTSNFADTFGVFNHLLSYQTPYKKFKIRFYKIGIYNKNLTCDFSGLVQLLSTLEFEKYDDVVVFGYPTLESLDLEILFVIYNDFLTGTRCIRIYE